MGREQFMAKRGGAFWTDARFNLELIEPDGTPPRFVPIGRPFALIGRNAQAELLIDDRDVSARHVYLHADERGLFAIDLATRTGTRFNGADIPCGWLSPGDELEIAGRVIRLESFELGGQSVSPPPCVINLLTDAGDSALVGLAIEPMTGRGAAWVVGSELAFVGRGDGCAIRLNQASVSRTHCVLLRTQRAAFVVDLPGQPTLVNGSPPRGAAIIREGDVLTLGQVRFIARVIPVPGFEEERVGELGLAQPVRGDLSRFPSTPTVSGLPTLAGQSFPIELVPPESRDAVLGWMLGNLHASQAEILRRQDDIQHSLATFLQQLHIDAGARHDAHTAQLEALAAEVRRLAAQQVQPAPTPTGYPSPYPPLAPGGPPRPARDVPSAPEIDPTKTFETAAWLLERIEKVGNENKFTFRSLLSRLGGTPRSTEDTDAETGPASSKSGDSEPKRTGGK
jgi:pSer/pThr/pTyr-binding forkhead associated (FHA) protein